MLSYVVPFSCILLFLDLNLPLFSFEGVMTSMGLEITMLSMIFINTVVFVSVLVKLFAKFYMAGAKSTSDFMLWFHLFIVSMLVLLISNSWWALILGWELLGITSFWLVSYYGSFLAHQGSILTLMTNRLGDLALIGTFLYFAQVGETWSEMGYLLMVFLFFSSTTKSAQFPFFSWLPAAMSAPTPISSLVHSSTLVTSGFFLLMKFNWAYLMNWKSGYILGVLTLLFGSMAALLDCDFKKVVAFSTLSQLGLLMMLFSSGSLMVVMFHLVAHAFFKSILFINVGVLIFNSFSNQSRMLFNSGLMKNFSHLSWFYLSLMNLSALPYLTGFYSKENGIINILTSLPWFTLILFMMIISLTLAYSLRLLNSIQGNSTSVLKSSSNLMYITGSTIFSWGFLVVLGYIWSYNLCFFELTDNLISLVVMSIGMVSYWLLSVKMSFFFYNLTRWLQMNLMFRWLVSLEEIPQLYWLPFWPVAWLSSLGWLAMLGLMICIFI